MSDGSIGKTAAASKTRPEDTTQYAAGDVYSESATDDAGTMLEFENVVHQAGGSGYILDALLIHSAQETVDPDVELWLFDAEIASELDDNAAFAPSDAELESCIGVIKFPTGNFIAAGDNGVIHGRLENDDGPLAFHKRFTCQSDSRSIYGVLVMRNTYAPESAEKITIRLGILMDNLKETD